MVFVKNCNFFHLFISGKIGHENELHDMLEENNACFDYKKTCEKVDKIGMFWKNLNFSTFLTSCFLFSWPILPKEKKLEKWLFLDQNHGLIPFGKIPMFQIFELLVFYSLERRYFVLEYRKTHFAGLYYLKTKSWKNGHFWTKTMG